MRRKIENTLIYSCGGFVVGVGVLGLFLPILQGVIFIALGLYIISLRSKRAKNLLDRMLIRFPFIAKAGVLFSQHARKYAHKVGIFF